MANGTFGGGNGSIDNPYLIEDTADLNAIRNNEFITYNYRLKNDIDMREWLNANTDSSGWSPISSFRGVIDGDGYCIYNLYMARQAVCAFITNSYGAKIRNLAFKNAWVGSRNGTAYGMGIIFGNMNTAECLVENCYIQGIINGGGGFGGIAYTCTLGTIKNCHADIYFDLLGANAYNVGGIVGHINGATIKNCYGIGKIAYSHPSMNLSTISATIGTGVTTLGPNTITSVFGLDTMYPMATFAGASTRKTITELQTASTFTGWETENYNSVYKLWRFTSGNTPQLSFLNKTEYLFYSNGQYKTFEFNPKTSLIPVMTAGTTSGVTITESGFDSGLNGWKIGDGTWTPWMVSSSTGWVRIDFGTSKDVSCILLEASFWSYNTYTVRTFSFQGSSDGTNWTTIITREHPNSATAIYYNFTKVNYRYYRVNVLNSHTAGVGIRELGIFEKPQNSWVDLGSTLPSDAVFINRGLSQEDLEEIPRLAYTELALNGSFDLVCNTDKTKVSKSYQSLTLSQDTQIADGAIMKTTLDFSTLPTAIRQISMK